MIGLLAALGLASAAIPDAAAAVPQPAPATTTGEPAAARLELLADTFRVHAAAALARPEPLPLADGNAVTEAIAPLGADDRRLLGTILAEGVQRIHFRGAQAVAGWWHPFADGWILTFWTHAPQGWRLERLGFYPGPAERPAPDNQADSSLTRRIGLRAQAAARDFDAAAASGDIYVGFSSGVGHLVRDLLLERRSAQQARLEEYLSLPSFGEASLEIALVATGENPAPDAAVGRRLAAMPGELRLGLRPTALAQTGATMTLALQSPIDPSLILLVVLTERDGNPTRPVRYEIVQLRM